jgi:ornithine decarboxylase
MDHVLSPLDLAVREAPEGPVAIARPHRVAAAAEWFRTNLTGDIFYAVKANPSPWVIDTLWNAGVTSFDVASEAEIKLVAERYPTARLAFMHPVKSRRSIARAFHDYGVKTFVVDCEDELDKILAETNGAKDLTLVVRLAVSNDAASLPLAQKFGATLDVAPGLLRGARAATEEMLGVCFHVGSQCMRPTAYRTAMMDANRAIIKAGVVADIVDVGGGFPAIYPGMQPPAMEEYAREIKDTFEQMSVAQNAALWAEPGRALVADAGSTVARVELRKDNFLHLNDGCFGTLYDATYWNWRFPTRLLRASRAKNASFSFYGPTCDSIDKGVGPFLLPADIREGDLIEIGMTGAYGVSMSSRFNGFGEATTIISADSPWPSMFAQPEPAVRRPARRRLKSIAGAKGR